MLGVSRQTLQRWFREGRTADVARDHRGWRVFKQSDVDRLRRIVEKVG
jgi:predicted site-specific integrase-resolvase